MALQMEKWEIQLHKEKENTQKLETISKVQYRALLDEHSRYKTLLLRSLEVESKAFRRRWVPSTVGGTRKLSRLLSPFALAPHGSCGSAASQGREVNGTPPYAMWGGCSWRLMVRGVPRGRMVCPADPGSGKPCVGIGVPAPLGFLPLFLFSPNQEQGGGVHHSFRCTGTCLTSFQASSSLSKAQSLGFCV